MLLTQATSYRNNIYSYGSGSENTNTPMIQFSVESGSSEVDYINSPLALSINLTDKTELKNHTQVGINCSSVIQHAFTIHDEYASLSLALDLQEVDGWYDILGKLDDSPTVISFDVRYAIRNGVLVNKTGDYVTSEAFTESSVSLFIPGSNFVMSSVPAYFCIIIVLHCDPGG